MNTNAQLINGEMVQCTIDWKCDTDQHVDETCAMCEYVGQCVTRGPNVTLHDCATRTCDVCGMTGDPTCYIGSGICATQNAIDEHGECACCGEYAKLHWGGLVVDGRDCGECRICDDCAISDDEYNALVDDIG